MKNREKVLRHAVLTHNINAAQQLEKNKREGARPRRLKSHAVTTERLARTLHAWRVRNGRNMDGS